MAVGTEDGAFCHLFPNPRFRAPSTHQLAYFHVFLPSILLVVVEGDRIGLSTVDTPVRGLPLGDPLTKFGPPLPGPFSVSLYVPVVPPLVD